jgi:hypothetical protein
MSVTAMVWVALFMLNNWLFERFTASQYINWIFLPAALRMLAVLLIGWVGALGIFVGSLVTGSFFMSAQGWDMVLLAAISSVAPLLALVLAAVFLGLHKNLAGLRAHQLLGLSVLCAGFGAGLHNIHFAWFGHISSLGEGFWPMFVGDLVGTAIVLYIAKMAMLALLRNPPKHSR